MLLSILSLMALAAEPSPSIYADEPDAMALSRVVLEANDQGNAANASEEAEMLVELELERHGRDHAHTRFALQLRAQAVMAQGRLEEAALLLDEVLEIDRRSGEVDRLINTLSNTGSMWMEVGNYDLARARFEEGIALAGDTEVQPGQLALLHAAYGGLLETVGELRPAIEQLERAAAIARQGEPDFVLGMVLHNLANARLHAGAITEARDGFLESIEVKRQVHGAEHPTVAWPLVGLSNAWMALDDYDRALEALEEALRLRTAVMGADHPHVLETRYNRTHVLIKRGEVEEAIAELEAMHPFIEDFYSREHPFYGALTLTLGQQLLWRGEHEEAREYLELALACFVAVADGEDHPNVIKAIDALAMLDHEMGRHTDSLARYEHAADIARRLLGAQHIQVAHELLYAADVHLALGQLPEAIAAREQALRIAEFNLALLDGLSEREAIGYSRMLRPYLNDYLGLTEVSPEQQYVHTLRSKGAVASRLQRVRALTRTHGEAREAAEQLRTVRGELARLTLGEGSAPRLKALGERMEELQRQLAGMHASDALASATPDVTPASLCEALPADTALVDLLHYIYEDEDRLVAFVLQRPACTVTRVDLGPYAPVSEAVAQWRAALSQPDAQSAVVDSRGAEVSELLWTPLLESLGTVGHVLLVPDAATAGVPFGALPTAPGRYLLEDVLISYLDRAGQLLIPPGEPGSGAVIVGGVDYDTQEQEPTVPATARGEEAPCLPERYGSLPHTDGELAAIERRWRPRRGPLTRLTGSRATEDTVVHSLAGKSVVHLATHGYFVTDECEALQQGGDLDPMVLSGLVFAGVNGPRQADGGDGVLTAAEVAGLDLAGTELVVLSACQTGLGRNQAGEGVLGLRRAFSIAGARTLVMSLWSVTDADAHQLMERLYQHHLRGRRGIGPARALRQAQLDMLEAQRATGQVRPQRWAGFIAAGPPSPR